MKATAFPLSALWAAALLTGSAPADWQERDRLIIMEAEDGEVGSAWRFKTDQSGYTGTGYLEAAGFNPLGWGYTADYSGIGNNSQKVRFTVHVVNPGPYFFKLRNIHPSGDSKNDCWLSVNRSEWHKVWDEGGTNMQFTFDDEFHRGMVHELHSGENLVELAARVGGYAVDRVVAFGNFALPADAWMDSRHPQNPSPSAAPDATIPPAPSGLTVSSITATSAVVSWQAVTGLSDLWRYEVLVDGRSVGVTAGTSYRLVSLPDSRALSFSVRARDLGGNSSPSATTQGVTPAFEAGVDGALATMLSSAPVIDATVEPLWESLEATAVKNRFNAFEVGATEPSATDLSAQFRIGWDQQRLYFVAEITDDNRRADNEQSGVWEWKDDGIELLLDTENGKQPFYYDHSFRFRFRRGDNTIREIGQPIAEHGGPTSGVTDGVVAAQRETGSGWVLEASIPWTTLKSSPSADKLIGLEVIVTDDDDGGTADHALAWYNGWSDRAAKPVHAVPLGEAKLTDPSATIADGRAGAVRLPSTQAMAARGVYDIRGRRSGEVGRVRGIRIETVGASARVRVR